MQQLAPNPLRFWEGEAQTVRAYLRNWLHRYHYPDEPRQLPAITCQGNPLKLDAVGWNRLAADTADFYGLSLPVEDLKALSTVHDMEAYVHQQLLKSAA